MKSTLTLIALLIGVSGCTDTDWASEAKKIEPFGEYPKVVTIDSCQYIQSRAAYSYFIYTHKGNCSNPIHKIIHQ